MRRDELARSIALVGARLRGDTEGEQALTGACPCDCKPLVEGLLMVVDLCVMQMAAHDGVSREDAAEHTRKLLQSLIGGESR